MQQTERGNDEKKLADQQTRHISGQSEARHGKEHEEQPEQKADGALDGQRGCLSKSMQDAGQCGGGIEQRAEQCKASDAAAGLLAVKEQPADDISGEKKEGRKKQAEQQASEKRDPGDGDDARFASQRLGFRDERKKEHAKRTGDSRWEQKQWQYHSA